MKKVLIFVLLFASLSLAVADPVKKSASMKLTFGWVRNSEGKRQSVKNIQLEIGPVIKLDPSQVKRVRPIQSKRRPVVNTEPPPAKQSQPHDLISLAEKLVGSQLQANIASAGMFDQSVYNSRTGNFYILANEFPDPSTLDDTVMASGAGKLWNRIWVGIHVSDSHQFLIRWQIFDDANGNQNHNESAFSNIIGPNNILGDPAGDFGGFSTPSQWPGYAGPGSYLVPFDLPAPSSLWPGINCPDNTIYMGQQFREPQANGEGPFDVSFKTIYTADVPVALGSSQDGFWYDHDDLNGIYSSDEFEVLGDINGQPQPFSNVAREIVTSGSSSSFGPVGYALNVGVPVSGNNFDLQESDNQYVIFKPAWNVARTNPNGQVTLEATSPSSALTGFRFSVETAASAGGGTMRIELFNFTSSAYDLYDTRAIPGTDTNIEITVPSNFSRYVRSSDRRVRSRVSYFAPFNVDRNYSFRMDRAGWIVTYP